MGLLVDLGPSLLKLAYGLVRLLGPGDERAKVFTDGGRRVDASGVVADLWFTGGRCWLQMLFVFE